MRPSRVWMPPTHLSGLTSHSLPHLVSLTCLLVVTSVISHPWAFPQAVPRCLGHAHPSSRFWGGLFVELPHWFSSKESTYKAGSTGDVYSIPGLGRSPGGGHGSSLQYSYLEDPMDRGAWWATVRRVTKGRTWLSD